MTSRLVCLRLLNGPPCSERPARARFQWADGGGHQPCPNVTCFVNPDSEMSRLERVLKQMARRPSRLPSASRLAHPTKACPRPWSQTTAGAVPATDLFVPPPPSPSPPSPRPQLSAEAQLPGRCWALPVAGNLRPPSGGPRDHGRFHPTSAMAGGLSIGQPPCCTYPAEMGAVGAQPTALWDSIGCRGRNGDGGRGEGRRYRWATPSALVITRVRSAGSPASPQNTTTRSFLPMRGHVGDGWRWDRSASPKMAPGWRVPRAYAPLRLGLAMLFSLTASSPFPEQA